MPNIIELKNVTKQYTNFKLDNVSLSIPEGCIIGLIGENGAGKTTLIKSILNLINIDSGTITIFNDTNKNDALKENIGVVLDNMFFPEVLTAQDINSIMRHVYQNWDSKLYYEYLTKFALPLNKPLKELSKGMAKKLEIVVALSHHPKLLILDEPTSGLDPVVRSEVLDLFLNFIQNEEHSILLSTHITSDLEHIADKIIFINDGQILLDKTRDEIFDNYGILKVSPKDFSSIDPQDIVTYKQNKYDYEILISNKEALRKKYKNYLIDKITLEELMVLMLKGEK